MKGNDTMPNIHKTTRIEISLKEVCKAFQINKPITRFYVPTRKNHVLILEYKESTTN